MLSWPMSLVGVTPRRSREPSPKALGPVARALTTDEASTAAVAGLTVAAPGTGQDLAEVRHPAAVAGLKAVHTVIFAGELVAILWLVVSGLVGRRDRAVGIAAAAVAAEAAVFLANDGVCPITPLTERMGAAHGSVSDIFLPDAVARTIPTWSTGLLAIAGLLHIRAFVVSRRGPSGADRPGRRAVRT